MGELKISYSQCAEELQTYEHVMVSIAVEGLTVANPFTDVRVTGWFKRENAEAVHVDGFCDDPGGKLFKVRLMPDKPGKYEFYTCLREGNGTKHEHKGTFIATDAGRKGILKTDPENPWHFIWSNTGEHFFYNGTTAYSLLGWKPERMIQAVDRLKSLGVNRIRVGLSARVQDASAWFEPVKPSDDFTFLLNPWIAMKPDSVEEPQFDVTGFNVDFWRRCEELLKHCRDIDMSVSIVFYVDGARPGVDPFGDVASEDEYRFYRYAVARLAAYPNLTWDISNEYRFFRSEEFPERMGAKLREWDKYGHLISVHGFPEFNFRGSEWAGFAMHQSWDEFGGYSFMMQKRAEQVAAGRIIPQVNEEYGYEDHYPAAWGNARVAPSRDADSRRRIAWEISMAGCYQTTGERANNPALGGWVNGMGDDSMTMLQGYRHMVDFFTGFDWWRLQPKPELIREYKGASIEGVGYFTSGDNGQTVNRTADALCLAEPGAAYVLYLPGGGSVKLSLEGGSYSVRGFNPRTGEWSDSGTTMDGEWTSPVVAGPGDWVFLLQKT